MESAQLLKNLPNDKNRFFYQTKLRNKTLNNYDLVDALMFIPISDKVQIRFNLYKHLKTNEIGIDIRHYTIIAGEFHPKKTGIRIPIKDLPQVLIRLQRIVDRYIK